MQDMTPLLAKIFGEPSLTGAIVTAVTPDSPAEKAGLTEGDVIQRIGTATPTDARDAMRLIAMVPVGDPAHLSLWRNGAALTMDVIAAEIPGAQSARDPAPQLNQFVAGGLELSSISDQDRRMYNLSSQQTGVLVTGVANGVFTGEQTLMPGDLILRVQETAVQTPGDVHRAMEEAWAKGHALVALLVRTKDGQHWIPLKISSMKAPQASR
jgi:serine protease Do